MTLACDTFVVSQKLPRRHHANGAGPIDLLPTCDEIAARAHQLFVADGRRLSRLAEYWHRAETELLERAFDRVARTL